MADETETEVVEDEQEQAAEELAEAAGVDRALIPNDLARAIFDARRDVVRCGVELDSAQNVVKLHKAALSRAQTHVMDLICEAENGQTRLFDRGDPETGKPCTMDELVDEADFVDGECPDCKGAGEFRVDVDQLERCERCEGSGIVPLNAQSLTLDDPATDEIVNCDECGEETAVFGLMKTAQGQEVCPTCFEVIRDSALTEHGHQE